ncbi:Ig-like domain-containing protein [Aquimarina spinulae]|uniref:Ig-like domain-containing protein n=3 Tax=Aquimarina spinulae TaxID=1192023 RepID=UPI0020C1E347|nr:Ig-like domain-containing protein [Aquimarina spinulae]
MKQLYLTFFVFSTLLWGIHDTNAQFTETFESLSNNQTTFTSNSQPFETTGGFRSQTSFPGSGASNSNVYLDNDSNVGVGTTYSIKTTNGANFTARDADIFLSVDSGATVGGSGGVIIRGKQGSTTIFTVVKNSGIPTTFSPDNGFFNIDFSTEGGTDNTSMNINELEFELTGSFVYIAVDEFTFGPEAVVADTNPPFIQTIVLSGTPPTTTNQVDFIVTFNENASNVTTDDFSIDATASATGNISAISGSGTSYTITVNGLSGEGTISIDLKSNTDIIDDLGNGNGTNGNASAFTAGEIQTVSACFEEDFENFSVANNTFSSNGLPFTSTNGLDVFFLNNAGASGSDQYLDNNGSGAGSYSIKTTGGELFTMKTIDLYLSSIVAGTTPTNNGTLTINGKVANTIVYTITKTTGFPTTTSNGDNGFFNLNFATDGAADHSTTNVDEIEIVIGSAFVYIAVDHFEFCEEGIVDTFAPEVQSIVVSGNPTTLDTSVDFIVTFNENVINVTSDDFSVDTTGTTGNIAGVTGSNNIYTVTVNNISGEGTISIDLNASTNIEDALGNSGPPAFTSGENHTVSACFVEDFESFADGASTFTSNGVPLSSTNGLVVKNQVNAGVGNSDKFLENNGTGAGSYSIKTTDNSLFAANTTYLYVSSITAGTTPTADGTLAIRGKVAGVTVYTITKTTGFPTTTANGNNGFFQVDFATDGSSDFSIINIDEIEIEILSSFVYLAVDNFEICSDTTAPRIQSITRQTPTTSPTNADTLIFSVLFNEAVTNVTTDDFSVSGTTGTITNVSDQGNNTFFVTVSGGNLAALNGTVSLGFVVSQNITDTLGNALTDTSSINTPENFVVDNIAPTGYSVAIDQSPINAGNDNAVSYTFSSAEVGATYNYTFSSSGGGTNVTGSGTVASAGATISSIDLSGLADGTITLSVTLTDVSGNTGSAATDTETKETVAPTGYSVAIDQSPINAGNDDAVSYTFSSAEVGATYNYTFSSSGGGTNVTGSGTVASAGATISGIDLSGLGDGTITLSVTLTDLNGNTGSAATDTETKDTGAPTGYSVTINQSPINAGNDNAVSYTFSSAEVGATYNYTFSSSGGGTNVTGSGTVASAGATISGIDLSGLVDGTITLSVTLTDVNGNTGSAATDTETKETVAPTGYSVVINQSPINAGNDDAVSYTFSSAEIGATYNYTFSSSGGAGTVTGTGTVASAGATISGIDLSGLADGTITLSVTLTDLNGNTGSAATDTETKDTGAPTGYSVTINQNPINAGNDNAVSYTFSSAEVGATYNYTFSSSGGGTNVTGSGTVASAGATISGIDLTGLADGTITLSVTLTDVNGNTGSAATDTETKETVAPTGYSVTINQSPISDLNDNAVSYTFSSAEVGATYNYTFSTSGGAGTVTGSGTVASAGATISSIDLSGLADGTITLSVTLTDVNGNTGSAATDTETKDTGAPTGYSVTINQSPINAGNDNAVSYTFSSAEVGATYNYTFSSSGGGTNVTGSGTVASVGATISGIDLSGLVDGTITLSVTLTDVNGNTGSAATDTETKDTGVPTGYSVTIDQSPINAGNDDAVSYTFSSAEVGATYNYTFSSSGGGTNVTGSGTVASAGAIISGIDLTGLADGTITLSVTLTDINGNTGSVATDTENKKAIPPTATITISDSIVIIGETTTITVTFSEAASGFDNTDLTIPNGTLSAVTSTDGNITFTATYTPAIDVEDNTNIIILDNTGITDSAGNTGTGTTNSSNFIIDMMPPTAIVEISDDELTTGNTATITIIFSEAVIGFTNTDLTIPNGTLTTVSSTDGNITFTATYTPTTGIADTENSITLDNTGVTDIAGNPGVGVTDSPNFTINTLQEIPVATLTFDKGFSPNGDGINDTWVIEGIEDFPNHTIQLFSRSGTKVFEAKDYQNNWDGISNGRLAVGNGKLPAGAYYYIIETGSQAVPPLIGWIYINY